jgi:hypothetical protein
MLRRNTSLNHAGTEEPPGYFNNYHTPLILRSESVSNSCAICSSAFCLASFCSSVHQSTSAAQTKASPALGADRVPQLFITIGERLFIPDFQSNAEHPKNFGAILLRQWKLAGGCLASHLPKTLCRTEVCSPTMGREVDR